MKYKLGSLITYKKGYAFKSKDRVSKQDGIPVIKVKNFSDDGIDQNFDTFMPLSFYQKFSKYLLNDNDILIQTVGSWPQQSSSAVGKVVRYRNLDNRPKLLNQNIVNIASLDQKFLDEDYLYWMLKSNKFGDYISGVAQGSANQASITLNSIFNYWIDLPEINTQKKIASILNLFDNNIFLNNQINANLLELSKTLFIKKFGNTNGDKHIKDYLSPKRGKNLLKKNVVKGSIPVIAGGLHPAAYHNKSNTGSPVITISASGANAGFVNIWLNRVWSSDSSFIDPSVTDNVYFWYLLLKNRQKEIFDSQTGSAQPHIYPKHIENMPVRKFDNDLIAEFNGLVTPIFENIGANLVERRNLNQIKNELLNKLF